MSRALVTGGLGFLGRHVVRGLEGAGWKVIVVDRAPGPAVMIADLAEEAPRLGTQSWGAVFHLAGLAHRVPHSTEEAQEFFRANVGGTENLLRGLEQSGAEVGTVVLVSTVAVYGVESGELLDESVPRLAADPYGASKSQAEDRVTEWCAHRGIRAGILRLPLVAGADPPGNLGAMVRGLCRGRYLGIGDGSARRSLVLASDVAQALPILAERGGTYHLTDGVHPSFRELESALCAAMGRSAPRRIPLGLARAGGWLADAVGGLLGRDLPLSSRVVSKMTSTLTFSDERARRELGWRPKPVVSAAADIVGTSE